MELALNGKVALVTGASRGIGKSCAQFLAQEGCHLAICSRKKQNLEETVHELKAEG